MDFDLFFSPSPRANYICSSLFRNLHNLQIVQRFLGIHRKPANIGFLVIITCILATTSESSLRLAAASQHIIIIGREELHLF